MILMSKSGCHWCVDTPTNGTLHAKRYFGKKDIEEGIESDFVARIFGPIEGTRDEMLQFIRNELC